MKCKKCKREVKIFDYKELDTTKDPFPGYNKPKQSRLCVECLAKLKG